MQHEQQLSGSPRLGASAFLVVGAGLAAVGFARSAQNNPPPQQQPPATQVLPAIGGAATSDSNQRMIAVTGIDVTGSSVLYLVDTQTLRLCVYQATSTGSNQGVRFVGARRIELDVELNSYNDRSQMGYADVLGKFVQAGLIKPDEAASSAAPDLSTDPTQPKRP
jgi:hypothetical protein